MAFFPYSDFHDINLDWIIKSIKALQNTIANAVKIPPGGGVGQALIKKSVKNFDVEWGTVSSVDELYYCTYGTTTNAEIESAIVDGKLPVVIYNNEIYTLAIRATHNHRFSSVYRTDSKGVQCVYDAWIPTSETFATATYVNNQIAAIPNLIPSGGTTGQVLGKASGTNYDTTWITPGSGTPEIEWVTYGTTTNAVIETAYQAGKIVACKYNNYIFYLIERVDQYTHYFMSVRSINSRYIRCYNNAWTFTNSTLLTQTAAQGMFVELPLTTPNAGDVITWTGTEWDSAPLPIYNGGVG